MVPRTHHMSRPKDRGKGELPRTARRARSLTVHAPVAQRLGDESFLARPLKLERHAFVPDLQRRAESASASMSALLRRPALRKSQQGGRTHPVTDPVRRASVDERVDATLEQRRDARPPPHVRRQLILYTHDVGERPSEFGCTPAEIDEALSLARAAGLDVLPGAQPCLLSCLRSSSRAARLSRRRRAKMSSTSPPLSTAQ